MVHGSNLFFEGVRRTPRAMMRPARPVPARAPLPDETYDETEYRLFATVFRATGLDVSNYRMRSLVRRLPACLRRVGVGTADEALIRVRQSPELAQVLIDVALLGVTEFCRDEPVFDALRKPVLPELRSRFGSLRVWSAACSNGHELYSVAMLLDALGCLASSELVGTDCREQAIVQAEAGVYPAETIDRLDPLWRQRYFRMSGLGCRLRDDLRGAVDWKVADLFQRVEPGPWHLVLWRNMAIYLNPDAAQGLWRRMYEQLTPGGFMVTGKADHPPSFLPLQRVATCVYRKREA